MSGRPLELLLDIRSIKYVDPFDGGVTRQFEERVSDQLFAETQAFRSVIARKILLEAYDVTDFLRKLREMYAKEVGLSPYSNWQEIDEALGRLEPVQKEESDCGQSQKGEG